MIFTICLGLSKAVNEDEDSTRGKSIAIGVFTVISTLLLSFLMFQISSGQVNESADRSQKVENQNDKPTHDHLKLQEPSILTPLIDHN